MNFARLNMGGVRQETGIGLLPCVVGRNDNSSFETLNVW